MLPWLCGRQGTSCPPRAAKLAAQSSGPTDCGAAPAPYINMPHRPPTRPTSCRFPLSLLLDLHRSQSPVASLNHSRTRSLVHPHHPSIHRHASQEVRRRCCSQGQVWLYPRQLPGSSPSAACRHHLSIYYFSACVRLMRGLQDMITDAIVNVRWHSPLLHRRCCLRLIFSLPPLLVSLGKLFAAPFSFHFISFHLITSPHPVVA